MLNCEMEIKGTMLTITVDLSKSHGLSKSGKSTIVATSQGNQPIPGTDLKIGLNVFK